MTRRSRPAEASGGVGAAAVALALALGAPEPVIAAVGIAAGLVPSAVTLLVSNGGLRGAWRRLLNGNPE